MVKFKHIYSIITLVIAVLLGVLIAVWDVAGVPEYRAAFKGDKLSKEDYLELKDYADIYAKTLDRETIDNNNIEITKEINEKTIIITVNETRGGIEATYPIEFEVSDNFGEYVLKISYKDGKYEEYSNIRNISFYIFGTLFVFVIFGGIIFAILYFPLIWIVSIINWIIVKIKKKKCKKDIDN